MSPDHDVFERVLAELDAEAERVRMEVRQEREALEVRLAPLQAELIRLEEALARLAELRPKAAPASDERARRGSNQRAILAALGERPGASAAEIAEVSGLDAKVVGTTLAKLAKQRAVKRTRRAKRRVVWRLAGSRPSTP